MEKADIDFVKRRFAEVFSTFHQRTIEEMWDLVGKEIVSDVEETASADWTSGDVDIAIERVVKGVFDLASYILK